MNSTNKITKNLTLIKSQTGISLELCDHFTGLHYFDNKPYFNAVLKERLSESLEYDVLKKWCDKYKTVQIENNGLKRIAVFI